MKPRAASVLLVSAAAALSAVGAAAAFAPSPPRAMPTTRPPLSAGRTEALGGGTIDTDAATSVPARPATPVPDPLAGTAANYAAALWRRTDTLRSAGLLPRRVETTAATASRSGEEARAPNVAARTLLSVGFFGHTGLLLLSTILVGVVKSLLFPPTDADEPKPAGMMNRCPWPFIFFHDPRQGFRDSPTWVVIVWVAIWRGWKYWTAAKKVGAL